MKPSMAHILMGTAASLTQNIAPRLDDAPDARGQVGILGLLLACAAQEADRCAETVLREQDALRALLLEASQEPLSDEDLRMRLRAASLDDDQSNLHISALEAQNAALMALLGELLAYVEHEQFDWAEKLEARIWRLLKASAERRALYLPVL